MSNKNLLNEAQIRQFMKLAKLAPLTPGFVQGLDESTEESVDEVRTPRPPNDAMENERGRSHGGGNTPINEEDEEAQMHDLEDADADEDHAEDLEMDAEEDLGDVADSAPEVADAGEQMIGRLFTHSWQLDQLVPAFQESIDVRDGRISIRHIQGVTLHTQVKDNLGDYKLPRNTYRFHMCPNCDEYGHVTENPKVYDTQTDKVKCSKCGHTWGVSD